MFVEAYSSDVTADVDAVIVGSGLAAMPIARAFSARGRRVLIIEGGDVEESADAAVLTETYDSGVFHDGYWARHWTRVLGGTSRRWSGWLVPLDARDLQQSTTGVYWPITLDALTPFYGAAATWLGRSALIADHRQRYLDTPFIYKPFSLGPVLRVHEDFQNVLATDPNILVLTRHVVTKLIANESRTVVSAVHLTDFARERKQLAVPPAVNLVLACGGLGNAQILLQPATESAVPIGNESGLVGQFLMEHPHARCGEALLAVDTLPRPPAEFGESVDALMLDDVEHARQRLLACTLSIDPLSDAGDKELVHTELERLFGRPLRRCLLYARSEQEPDALNCAKLLDDTDWAGSYRLETHNCFSKWDLRSIETVVRLLAQSLADRRIGSVRVDHAGLYRNATGGGHTMGTTRMGETVSDSVCDATQRVHGYDNLYLAGSSVFPTGGAANPTLTIVALSLRLADHLLERARR